MSRIRNALIGGTILLTCLAGCASGRGVREGYVTTDDSVRQYYRK